MEGRDILRLKRIANRISLIEDINTTDNILLDFARKIFVNHFGNEYEKMDVSLYQTEPYKHPKFPNLIIDPHFVRDDGVIIYLQFVQNNINLMVIPEEIAHVSMEVLGIKNTSIFTIHLYPDFNINDLLQQKNIGAIKYYDKINEKRIKYMPEISEKYTSQFSNEKILEDNKVPNEQLCDFDNSKINNFVRNEWVSATKTRNYALKDTLLDWLDYWYDKSSEKRKFNVSYNNVQTNEHDFLKFIINKGIQFESKVINLIKQKFKPTEFVTICNDMKNYDQKVLEYEKKTIDEIMKGTPIIYQAMLMNRNGPLSYSYGIPDLLVRSDYLCKIMDLDPLDKKIRTFKAPNLNGNYHYVIIDIKFTTLELCADGKRIRNSGNFPAYKCQLYIYNHALGKIQGYEPEESYILGRRYKYESKGKYYLDNNCFARFGHIQYYKWDREYIDESIAAIRWIKKLRTEGKEWTLLPKPSVPELYPNMSTTNETPWDEFKMEYANKIGEITLLWNCGVKNRQIAHENGIYSYMNQDCNSEMVGINGPKQAPILDEIIRINRKRNFDSIMDKIFIKLNKDIDNKWMEQTGLRISVDFEIINSIFDNFSDLPMAQDQNYLFMIGVAYKTLTNSVEYKMFLIAELSKDAEFQIIYQFYKFLREITDKHVGKNMPIPPLYHWGHIERSFFTNLCIKLKNIIGEDIDDDIELMNTELSWYDLSECFKCNPIVINGCFKFGLKEIAGRLSELGLIQSNWNNSYCNGNTAMIMAYRAYQTSKQTGINITKNYIINEIMEYNKIDCIVIHEIVDLLQKKAISINLLKEPGISINNITGNTDNTDNTNSAKRRKK